MSLSKILFIDRDGTLIDEPGDYQVDSLEKLKLKPLVIPALIQLKKAGFKLVMVTNQDGLGTNAFPQKNFDLPHAMLMDILSSQGVKFEKVLICPHFESDNCFCRKPNVGLVIEYLRNGTLDFNNSYVIGDRKTDLKLAENLGIKGLLFTEYSSWMDVALQLTTQPRIAHAKRITKETTIEASVNLDSNGDSAIDTGIGFFNHMLEQLAKHGGFNLTLTVKGDLHIDEHHTVEDTAILLGNLLRTAVSDKWGIQRYGFILPMDEAQAQIAIDFCDRNFFVFEGNFNREKVGDLSTELVSHFFNSLANSLRATLHIKINGENTHHMIESVFKGVGRVLRMAFSKIEDALPTTKGVL